MSNTYEGYEYRNEEGEKILLDIEYSYHPAYRGYREGGLQLEPDESEGIEIYSIIDEDGNPVDIPEEDMAEIEDTILEDLKDSYEDAKAEAKLERMQEMD